MIPNRFIREYNALFVAYVIDGYYKRLKSTNGIVIKPQYYIINEGEFLTVITEGIYRMLHKDDAFMPIFTQTALIPKTHLVKDGDKVPDAIIKKALKYE